MIKCTFCFFLSLLQKPRGKNVLIEIYSNAFTYFSIISIIKSIVKKGLQGFLICSVTQKYFQTKKNKIRRKFRQFFEQTLAILLFKNLYVRKINHLMWPSTQHLGLSTMYYLLTIVIPYLRRLDILSIPMNLK